jgi:hypothetical protein
MMRHMRAIGGVTLIVLGCAFALLPEQWIEERFGFEPDGGNGFIELLLAMVPILVGLTMLVGGPVIRHLYPPAVQRRGDIQ